MKNVACIIMDWAGTAVDYGCFAPLQAFIKVFEGEYGIHITPRQAREPMGLLKIDHIKAILSMPSVNEQFKAKYNRDWNMDDVVAMNKSFEKYLFESLSDYTTPIDGVIDTLQALRDKGIKIGSTTGYTQEMMNVVVPGAAAKGYKVDHYITPTNMPAGRPAPFMIFNNMITLNVDSTDKVVKVGDTISDIKEGVNAKVWTVGLVLGSSELGLTQEEVNNMSATELAPLKEEVRERMLKAGAHFVIDTIEELPSCIETINNRLSINPSNN